MTRFPAYSALHLGYAQCRRYRTGAQPLDPILVISVAPWPGNKCSFADGSSSDQKPKL